jgi:molybdopterin molybdotransferase
VLQVIDTISAGSIPRREVKPGTAMRIMTGAPTPKGADSIVRFEDTDEAQREKPSNEIGILKEVEVGREIRRAGEDITKGSMVLSKGTVIGPSEVGVLASVGRSEARVIRRPLVAILATGDELVDITQPLTPSKIYNSNTYTIAAQIQHYGGIPKILGIAQDSEDSLVTRLRQGLDADMLITSGGVSVGDFDIVKDVLAKEGEVAFWTVRMKPGKPLAFGRIKGIPHLGLPGNPVSSMITTELFARPAILKMMGKRSVARATVAAVIEDSIVNNDGRRIFARATVEKRNGQYFARLTGPQGSGILTSMASADGLDTVQVMMLDWRGD